MPYKYKWQPSNDMLTLPELEPFYIIHAYSRFTIGHENYVCFELLAQVTHTTTQSGQQIVLCTLPAHKLGPLTPKD